MKEAPDWLPYAIVGAVFIVIFNSGILIPIIAIAALYFFLQNTKGSQRTVHLDPKTMAGNININHIGPKFKKTIGSAVAVVLLVVLVVNMIRIVPAGQTGVYHLFGKVKDKEYSSGIHLINPFATIKLMSIRTEQYTMSVAPSEGQRVGDDSIEALTKEGLKVRLDMTVLYHLKEESASDVYKELGLSYEEKIIRPEVRSAIREVIALYEAKDIYSDKREEAVSKIEDILRETITPRGIEIESVLLRNVGLPNLLTNAIEEKLTAEQEAQKYDFILQREEKEAERKRIEAQGQRDAQQIVNQSLTDRYIQFLYVQNIEDREGTIYVPYDLPLMRGL